MPEPNSRNPADRTLQDRGYRSPLVWLTGAWILGLLCGRGMGGLWMWMPLGAAIFIASAAAIRFQYFRAAIVLTFLAAITIGASWWCWQIGEGATWGLIATDVSRLSKVEGIIEGKVFRSTQPHGAFGDFDYRDKKTLFVLRADRVLSNTGQSPISTRLLVYMPSIDLPLETGDRVECTGWLLKTPKNINPGEPDRRQELLNQGIVGQLALRAPGNCRILQSQSDQLTLIGKAHRWSVAHARDALMAGLSNENNAVTSLLKVVLLGDWHEDIGDIRNDFKRAGLAHILAISGLHLGILAVGVWWLCSIFIARPTIASALTIALLLIYIAIVPVGTAMLRAGIMMIMTIGAMGFGRRISPIAALSCAALIILIWRPQDLFAAGFQLSFTIVAGLIVFTPRLSNWLTPPPVLDFIPSFGWHVRKKLSDYLAVSLVAWCMSMPLTAYHFGAIVPTGLFTAMLALPLITIVLWIGYIKLAIGFIWASGSAILATPLESAGELLLQFASWAGNARISFLEVAYPSPIWATTCLAVITIVLLRLPHSRDRKTIAALFICIAWLAGPNISRMADRWTSDNALSLTTFAVGNGACHLLQSEGETLIFDCGSSNYFDITTVAIGPALRKMGIRKIDTLVLSHPDTDHFSGSIELIDTFSIKSVVLTDAFFKIAEADPDGAAAFLLDAIKTRQITIKTVTAGWSADFGQAKLQIIWPPPATQFKKHNDASIILRATAANRSVLLTGDIQNEAIAQILDHAIAPDLLAADILELPHHGSMVPSSIPFIEAVNPTIVIQSTGNARLRHDPWVGQLRHITRHITATQGMAHVTINKNQSINYQAFLDQPLNTVDDLPYNNHRLEIKVNP